jgi:hypothetical protein
MEAHIRFDSDPLEGHGALSRQMTPDASVVPLWEAFKQLLLNCAPNLWAKAAAAETLEVAA